MKKKVRFEKPYLEDGDDRKGTGGDRRGEVRAGATSGSGSGIVKEESCPDAARRKATPAERETFESRESIMDVDTLGSEVPERPTYDDR